MLNGSYHFVAGEVVKLIHSSPATNEVLVFNLALQKKQTMDYHGFKLVSQPAFKIGDVARMLGKKSDTIRKWEQREIIPPQKKWQVGDKKFLRFYTQTDIEGLRDVVASLHVGRPRKDGRKTNRIPPAGELKRYIKERIKNLDGIQ